MSTHETYQSYPLHWPAGQPRKAAHERRAGRFKVSLAVARDELRHELYLLDATDVVISTNVPTRRDGLLYASLQEPSDPAVAVYFTRKGKPFVFACDTYERLLDNLRAIGETVKAFRAIQRHGASDMLEQAFVGFAALPPAGRTSPWWEVLRVPADASLSQIQAAHRELAQIHHPDRGGSARRMAEINAARDIAVKGSVNGAGVRS